MKRGYLPHDLANFDDPQPDRANEERASRHIIYAMVGAATAVAGLYALGMLCGIFTSGM
jgi:uncharacterized membrane protein YebE (DUF533 family)